jgi:hypothetical protein
VQSITKKNLDSSGKLHMPEKDNILNFLQDLGTVDQLRALAQEESGTCQGISNSHIHLPPNFSAFDSVQEAVDKAAAEDVVALGCGNYYDYSVYTDLVTLTRKHRIFPVFGTEIIALDPDLVAQGVRVNDPGNPGKIYICGKGITRFLRLSDLATRLLSKIRASDTQRMAEMTTKMGACFDACGIHTGLDAQGIVDRVAARHQADPSTIVLQERHIAQAFQERLFDLFPKEARINKLTELFGAAPKSSVDNPVSLQIEIRSVLMKSGKPCFVPEDFVTLAEAAQLIQALGGIVCYPVLADGSDPVCEYEADIDALIATLRQNKISMVEFIPTRNQPDTLTRYVTQLRKAGFAVVAGTEHNTLDKIPIEPLCVKSQAIPAALQEIFWEGTCVMAAHQYLVSQGECGFVDQKGQPNTQYDSPEERIQAFAGLGGAVIRAYRT